MERIVENKPEVVTLLQMQYRMNEQIMRFSSNWFYDGKVESAPQIKYRGILDYDIPIEWRQATNEMPDDAPPASEKRWGEEFLGESFGRINRQEAEFTLHTLQAYFIRSHLALPRSSAIPTPPTQTTGVLQALPKTHQREHRRRLSRAGTGCHPHLTGAFQCRGRDRIPTRPAAHECGNDPRPHEAHHPRRCQDTDQASLL